MTEEKVFYRFDDESYSDSGTSVRLFTFPVLRRTPKGAWLNVWGRQKFCLCGGGKRYAHETPKLALESFIARKKRQVLIKRSQLQIAETALDIAKGMLQNENYGTTRETPFSLGAPFSDL